MSSKVARGSVRSSFTKTYNELRQELDKVEGVNEISIKSLAKRLENRHDILCKADDEINQEMIQKEATQEEMDAEFDGVMDYRDKFSDIFLALQERYRVDDFETASRSTCIDNQNRNLGLAHGQRGERGSVCSTSSVHGDNIKSRYKLPKLELRKFDGDPRKWLDFWCQFKGIHEDRMLTIEDKFQYLIQSMEKKSPAESIVMSFPPTAANYPLAIKHLTSRFGQEKVLVEVYVRDLLKLVLKNAGDYHKLTLSALYDSLETKLRGLETLGVTSDKYASMLYPLVESALPEEILKTWERIRNQADNLLEPEIGTNYLEPLMKFLRSEVDSEMRLKLAKAGLTDQTSKYSKKSVEIITASELFNGGEPSSQVQQCVFCGKSHASQNCYSAKKLPKAEKDKIIRNKSHCLACLQKGHYQNKCKSNIQCSSCGGKHYPIMCPVDGSRVINKSNASVYTNQGFRNVVLQTIIVTLVGSKMERAVRVMIDSGSHRSYITKRAVKDFGFESIGHVSIAHTLFGGLVTEQKKHGQFLLEVKNTKNNATYKFLALDTDKICGDIPMVPNGIWSEELKNVNIELSDDLQEMKEIHILMGADVASKIYTGRIYHTQTGPGPVAFETIFGWSLMGQTNQEITNDNNTAMVTSLLTCGDIVDSEQSTRELVHSVHSLVVSDMTIQDLWKLDVIGIHDSTDTKSKDELSESAMRHFKETVSRKADGRYEISLPWIQGHLKVPNNRKLAENRLNSAVRKLKEEGKVWEYQKIFNEWLDLGIIERVPTSDLRKEQVSYLPHFPVFNPKSTTTPIRPVFDASAKQRGFPSLNDCLEKGPNLLELIVSILLRFRLKKLGAIADITKAFLQISVNIKDREFLRFLWYENGELVEYRHCRVVFGVSASPFLLAAVLNYHLEKVDKDFQASANLVKDTMYVDNCVASVDTKVELEKFIKEATHMCKTAKFELRGWIWSNDTVAGDVARVGSTECGLGTGSTVLPNKSNQVQVLGLLWNPEDDTLAFDLRKLISKDSDVTTKRKILAATHGIFDPIGFAAPVTIVPKVMMKEAFRKKLNWDDPVPVDIAKKFKQWLNSVEALSDIRIPRWISSSDAFNKSLHIFTDASKDAYAAVAFLRSENEDGVIVQLVLAKSRVSTIKPITIPKLELIGCECGAKMLNNIKKTMDLSNVDVHLWTDSSDALAWIQRSENWQVFVYNRVQKIRELTDLNRWRHIPGQYNPADLPSRGCTPKQLSESKWWEGPSWLKETEDKWPKSAINYNEETIMTEAKRVVVSHIVHEAKTPRLFRYFSQFRKQVRMIAWIKRWRTYKRGQRRTVELSIGEEEEAEKCLWRIIQTESFHPTDKIIKQLKAWKDESGLWRIKTKIINREDSMEFVTPILLPKKSSMVERLIRQEHAQLKHAGVQIMMGSLRERYWIIHNRIAVKKVVRSCSRCERYMAKPVQVVEAALPLNRVRDSATFEISGVDLGGPLILDDNTKSWFVLFTCAVYRAMHLELVTSLSTEAFIQALRRFIARRGRPAVMYADNGLNFVGTSNCMNKLDWNKITNHTPRIKWIFNPPAAPWWGGWWERLVAMVKQLIRRILGRSVLNYEELATILCDCEQVINSRPLTYLTEDADDLLALTPMMFLNDLRSQGVADLDLIEAEGLRKRFKYRQQIREDLRSRFRSEYLAYLLHQNVHKIKETNLKVGDVVFIEGSNTKRLYWPLGKIIEILPSADGVSRSVRLKTSGGELVRPVQRLYPMEATAEKLSESKQLNLRKERNSPVQNKPEILNQPIKKPREVRITRSGRQVKIPERLNY